MRVPLALVVCLCAAALSHAQLTFGPGGLTKTPINLGTVAQYVKAAWGNMMGSEQKPDSVKVARKSDGDGAYNTDLAALKSRIQEASESAASPANTPSITRKRGVKVSSLRDPQNPQDGEEESPLLRAILLPKKKVAVGKWPWVYGVLNGLLLGAAITLAAPYFFEGETVVTQYENYEKDLYGGYGYGGHHGYGGYPPHGGVYHGYSEPAYGQHPAKVTTTKTTYRKRPKPLSSYLYKPKDKKAAKKEKHYYPPPAPVSYGPPAVIHGPPSTSYHGAHTENVLAVAHPQETVSTNYRLLTGSELAERSGEVEASMNELFYYNPTIFMSSEASSYGCIEKMVCLNPSRSGRNLAMSSAAAFRARAITGNKEADDTNWADMIERLDSAAAQGGDPENCAQFYCPPPTPTLNPDQSTGDHYLPPPEKVSDALSMEKLSAVFKRNNVPFDYDSLALHFKVDGQQKINTAQGPITVLTAAPSADYVDQVVKPIDSAPRLRTPYPRVAVQNTDVSDDYVQDVNEQLLQLGTASNPAVVPIPVDNVGIQAKVEPEAKANESEVKETTA